MAVTQLTQATHTRRLADYLPSGRLFGAKNLPASNLHKLITGIAYELFTADGYLVDYQDDIVPDATTYFIEEWESALGIPDGCFAGVGTLSERRRDIVVKLAALGAQTAEDFVRIGALFGVAVTVESLARIAEFTMTFPIRLVESGYPRDAFPMTFPFTLFIPAVSKFTLLVSFSVTAVNRFDLTFPFTFGDEIVAILECLFRRLKPANCDVIFQQV